MSGIDLLKAINKVSDVVHNRPRPLREFDQIYMKTGDLVIQSDVVAGWAPASASPSSATATSSAFASPICATPKYSRLAPRRSPSSISTSAS
ncbi:hypothetical protein [Sphingobium sp. CFD-2]|uniref:hypothetical protein n=1 Tax=Sphingobium sp. CFD-2 TaxID=2878542 RepID=UPI00214B0E7B|nr:hypothetical protein [Sphingobium sp. CFD-2]